MLRVSHMQDCGWIMTFMISINLYIFGDLTHGMWGLFFFAVSLEGKARLQWCGCCFSGGAIEHGCEFYSFRRGV